MISPAEAHDAVGACACHPPLAAMIYLICIIVLCLFGLQKLRDD